MIDKINEIVEKYKYYHKENIQTVNADFLSIRTDKYYLNNGHTIMRDTLIKPFLKAAMIIPKTKDDKYIMVIQSRVATKNGVTIEFPAGLMDDSEDIITGIKRELLEETGYKCEETILLKEYYPDVATTPFTLTIVYTEDCQKVSEQNLDEDEFLTCIAVTFDEIQELIKLGYIVDVNTLFGIELIKNKH